jgi:UDP-N-acetylmuramyl pentapeptide phosphotransferase/UDP-N-acetylglucosamine-1-phosphate transferase
LAILAAVIVAGGITLAAYGAREELFWLAVAAGGVVVVSFFDDRSHIAFGYRLLAQVMAALVLLYGGYRLNNIQLPGARVELADLLVWGLSLLYIVWMVNLYNFMDGMDGFAGGMATVGFAAFGIIAATKGENMFAAFSFGVAGAAAGFLLLNFPPARIFMGDVGSCLLGLLAAGLSLWAAREQIFPLWIAILVFSPFIVDASVTLAARSWRKERLWSAHKSHFYQRLVELGWGHRRTVVREYVLMLACTVSAIVVVRLPTALQWMLILVWVVMYASIMGYVHRLESRRKGSEIT